MLFYWRDRKPSISPEHHHYQCCAAIMILMSDQTLPTCVYWRKSICVVLGGGGVCQQALRWLVAQLCTIADATLRLFYVPTRHLGQNKMPSGTWIELEADGACGEVLLFTAL
jgi:hypothetical protein